MIKFGIIDSGKGGTYVGDRLKQVFNVEIIQWRPHYFISYSNLPYIKLRDVVDTHLEYLYNNNVDAIIIGCMSLSTTINYYIEQRSTVPVYNLYQYLPKFSKDTLIIGTQNTINSNKFNEYIRMSCPPLSKAIEGGSEDLIPGLLKSYEHKYSYAKVFNNVILGCSHYPIAIKIFTQYYKDKTIIDPVDYLIDGLKLELINKKNLIA